MALIPGTDQGQILVPSSPVPIGSTSDERYQGEVAQKFGGALFALGDALDSAAKAAAKERNNLLADIAADKFRGRLQKESMKQIAASAIPGDDSGVGATEAMLGRASEFKSELMDGLENGHQQQMFMAKIGNYEHEAVNITYAKEVEKRTKATDALWGVWSSGKAAIAKANPNKASEVLAELEIGIHENADIPDAQKALELLKAQQYVVNEVVNGFTERKDFAGAKAALETLGSQYFKTPDKEKMLDRVDTEEYSTYNRDYMKLQRDELVAKRARDEKQQNILNEISAGLKVAGNSDIERQPWLDKLELAKAANQVDAVKADSLSGSKVFLKLQDDRYDIDLTSRVFRSGDFGSAIDKINRDSGVTVSFDRAKEMVVRYERERDRFQNDKIRQQRIQTGEDLIRAQAQESMQDFMSSFAKRQLQTKVNLVTQEYYKGLSTGANIDPDVWSKYLVSHRFGADVGMINNNSDVNAETSVNGLNNLRDKEIKRGLLLKQQGKMTPQLDKEIRGKLNDIQKKTKRLGITHPEAQPATAPPPSAEATKTGTGARSK